MRHPHSESESSDQDRKQLSRLQSAASLSPGRTAPVGQTPPEVANSHDDTELDDPVTTKQNVA